MRLLPSNEKTTVRGEKCTHHIYGMRLSDSTSAAGEFEQERFIFSRRAHAIEGVPFVKSILFIQKKDTHHAV